MSRCPSCNTDEAYIGIISVECVNVKCAHYSQKQKDEIAAQKAALEAHTKPPIISYRTYSEYDYHETNSLDSRVAKDPDRYDPYDWVYDEYNKDASD